ncbi:phenylacetate--CoA ligase [Aminithiophilus ramosus]|uniref:Phenylacetate-coenzyme A ligase n=2 Tax=Synergistales TaxID=649776 RepID=A0A9Q7AQ50_9BACT|nr:phenylacetate--CoA ligase [Aminithiophilus ramosus]QTX32076.1 phenylacetate--CoA ligase [Aminithiophilus ramosus]QVL35942.1 phenylacetate--CoA ligase [Synergistota bacterium]
MTAEQRTSQLRALIERLYDRVPLYRERMEALGIVPEDLRSPEDLRKFPFTVKQDLRDAYPYGLLACDRSDLARLHASSGTTGKPTVVGYTRKDLDLWAEAVKNCMETAGVGPRDIVQVTFGYGLFTGGLGIHDGAEALGATVIPASGGFSERQLLLMEDLGTTVIACTPSYALHLADLIEARGLKLKLRLGIFGAEPWSEALRKKIEERLGIRAIDIYGLSEVMGPGVAIECPCQAGLHLQEDLFHAEIVDPETGLPLPDGEEGELVLTTLGKEGMPLLRYRTRDVTRILPGTCACGREGTRLARIRGRSDDMLIIRGVNVYPSQIETALGRVEGLSLHYLLEVSDKEGLKELTVCCEPLETLDREGMAQLTRRSQQELLALLGVRVGFRLVEPGSLSRSEGKAARVRNVA